MLDSKYTAFYLMLFLNFALLTYNANNLSISFNEAQIFYENGKFFTEFSFLHEIINFSHKIFADILGNDLAIRLPFLLTHLVNIFLMYKISQNILKSNTYALISTCIFMYLPGILTSAIIINSAAFIVLISLLAVLFVQNSRFIMLALLCSVSVFIWQPCIVLYFALLGFGLYSKNKVLTYLGTTFCIIWLFIFEVNFSGKPKGYIIDTMAIFGAAFSPLIFIYFIYSFYRIWIKEKKDYLWFVATTAFCFCLLSSIREKVALQLFLPFCVIFIPHMVNLFFISYNVRLPKFRLKYKILAFFLIFSLTLNAGASFFYNFLYAFLKSPNTHFAYKYDIAKELAQNLKQRNISEILLDYELGLRLSFYGIKNSGDKYLNNIVCPSSQKPLEEISIKKANKIITKFYICE